MRSVMRDPAVTAIAYTPSLIVGSTSRIFLQMCMIRIMANFPKVAGSECSESLGPVNEFLLFGSGAAAAGGALFLGPIFVSYSKVALFTQAEV